MKKYEMLKDDTIIFNERTLYRIRLLKDIDLVRAGTLGGYIEREENLSHKGNCWVYDNAKVFGNARICNNTKVFENAIVSENSQIHDNVNVCDDVCIRGDVHIYGNGYLTSKNTLNKNTGRE